jgi:hypothetical protein
MSFGSNGVDQVHSLRKISTQLRLANLGVNGASSASFASTFTQSLNGPKRLKYEFWVQWIGSGAFIAKNSDATSFSELVR